MPSINFNRSSENDLIWNSSTESYTSPKPEHLYGWTDSSITETTYYAWKREYDNYYCYTITETPTSSDKIYHNYNDSMEEGTEYEGIYDYDSSTNPPRAKIHDMMDWDWFYRDSSKDVTLPNPLKTVYTDSTTLTIGMELYDNTGTSISKTVGTINQDGSFDVVASGVTLSFISGTNVASYTIDNVTYTGNSNITLTENDTHNLEAVAVGPGPNFQLLINNNEMGPWHGDANATFVISDNSVTFTGDNNTYTYTTSTSTQLTLVVVDMNCCVPYYTEINYYDGTTKTAENVQVGDKLLGYNELTKEFTEVEVLKVIQKMRNELVTVKTNNYEIEITPDHPILTNKGWAVYDLNTSNYHDLEKIQLNNSLKILTKDGDYEDIISIDYRELENPIDTYTYNVTEGIDTYVAAGIISHNAPC